MDLITHPAFSALDTNFVNTLQKTLNSLSNKSDLEVLGTLMAISNEAQQKNIILTPEMQAALLEYLKNRMPTDKRAQFEAILSFMMSQMN